MKTLALFLGLGLASLSPPAAAQSPAHRRPRNAAAQLSVASAIPGAGIHVGGASYLASAGPGAAPKILPLAEQNYIGSYRLSVGYQKTTHVIFPSAVTYVDLGNGGIIADRAQGAENIVKVKARQPGFPETNMTVVTTDGRLYSFIVGYEANPRVLNYNLAAGRDAAAAAAVVPVARSSKLSLTQSELEGAARQALKQPQGPRARRTRNGIALALRGLYTQHDVFFFPLRLANRSNIGYDVDFIKFYVRDRKVARRTARQETELAPVFVYPGAKTIIPGPGAVEQVYALRKFTLPADQHLVVEMVEQGGGRQLSLVVRSADLLRARKLR